MVMGCPYGSHRSLEPKGSLPQTAWKLDSSLPIYDNELLIEAEVLNVNSASFAQLINECGPNPKSIADKIMSITRMRGKMHNPITGSGGMLLGRVKQIGKRHPAAGSLQVGEEVATMVSLTLTPLNISRIKGVSLTSGQVDLEGNAILFESGLYARVPEDIPMRILLPVLDEAGSIMEAYKLTEPGESVAIVGADEKIGILSLYAVRNKLGSSGRLVAIVRSRECALSLAKLQIADKVIVADETEPLEAAAKVLKGIGGKKAALTIDCLSAAGLEMLSIMITKDQGKVYYASPATRYTVASLGAEGLGKDVDLFFYKGYIKEHTEYAVQLLRGNPQLQEYLQSRFLKNSPCKWSRPEKGVNSYPEANLNMLTNMSLGDIVIHSAALQNTVKTALRIAPYETTVLITGESGTGKELMAQIIHKASKRQGQHLLKINCAAIPESLIEAELFGYEGGAFTGALKEGKAGFFEAAGEGTLFLDEIGEMPLVVQAKLLRAIQEKEILRVGGTHSIHVNVRLISATNRDLRELVDQGKFREDLYYRINVVNLRVPPLRERREEIPALVDHFLSKYNALYGTVKNISPQGMRILYDHAWPGNIRELENLMQRLILCQETDIITDLDILSHLLKKEEMPSRTQNELTRLDSAVAQTERELFESAVQQYRTTREIAAALNTSQSTVVRRIKKFNLR